VAYGWLSFLTDYGTQDGFVASCHGVMAGLAPQARVIDVTHEVPRHDVRRGATLLAAVVPYLPESVHLAVVDPGVGTARRGVAVVTPRGVLVGPDNGLLCEAADALGGPTSAFELTDPRYRLPAVSATFHGRDVFAPAAAHVAAGLDPSALGSAVPPGTLVRLPEPVARLVGNGPQPVEAGPVEGRSVEAEVVHADRFGNVQLAADARLLDAAGIGPGSPVLLSGPAGRWQLHRAETFGSVPPGEPLLFVDSSGRAALAVNQGSAATAFALRAGDVVRLARADR
jgi:S-adenosylmethionine hydrolase